MSGTGSCLLSAFRDRAALCTRMSRLYSVPAAPGILVPVVSTLRRLAALPILPRLLREAVPGRLCRCSAKRLPKFASAAGERKVCAVAVDGRDFGR